MSTPRTTAVSGGIRLSRERPLRPGEDVTFTIESQRWPDRRLDRVEVELAYRATFLLRYQPYEDTRAPDGTSSTSPGWLTREARRPGAPEFTVVAKRVFPVGHLDPLGRLEGSLTVPEDGPPTIDGVVRWVVRARFRRRLGRDQHAAAEVRVLGPRTGHLAVARTLDGRSGPVDDWLLHVVSSTESARADRRQDVQIEVRAASAAPGDAIAGTMRVQPGPAPADRRRRRTWTRRGARRAEEAAERLSQVIEAEAVQVLLECWRGSVTTRRRVVTVEETIAGARAMTTGGAYEYPFTIEVPRTVELDLNDDRRIVGRPPPTFHGTRLEGSSLDDFRWRVVGRVVTRPVRSGPRRRTRAWRRRHVDERADDPLWAATEVRITDCRRVSTWAHR